MDQMVVATRVVSPQFTLRFSQWSRLAHAQLGEVPVRVDLELRGIPSHAWEQRTADTLLEGCGFLDSVDPATANREDMSCFRLSLWTHDVDCIPAARWLAVPEPGEGSRLVVSSARRRPSAIAPKVLWYRVKFWVAGICTDGPLPPSEPSSGSQPDEQPPARRRRRRRAGRRHRGARMGLGGANAPSGAQLAGHGGGSAAAGEVDGAQAEPVDAAGCSTPVAQTLAADRWVAHRSGASTDAATAAGGPLGSHVRPEPDLSSRLLSHGPASGGAGKCGGDACSVAGRSMQIRQGTACCMRSVHAGLSPLQRTGSPAISERDRDSSPRHLPAPVCLAGDRAAIDAAEAFLSAPRAALEASSGKVASPVASPVGAHSAMLPLCSPRAQADSMRST
jgi:hypothetical protein